MKRYSFFLALAILVVSFGLANAQFRPDISVDLNASTGLWYDGSTWNAIPGSDITFALRYDNSGGVAETGITNGFEVHSAGSFTPIVGEPNPAYMWAYTGIAGAFFDSFVPKYWSNDGAAYDTVAFGGVAAFFGVGFPAGFNDIAMFVHTGGLIEGQEICIDSCWFPPAGVWKWGSSGSFPTWNGLADPGELCFTAATPPCLPPVFAGSTPVSMTESHCDGFSYQFSAALDPADNDHTTVTFVSASVGTIQANGMWTYNPTIDDIGSVVLTVEASNGECTSTADVNLNITNEAPVITTCGLISQTTGLNSVQMAATDDCDQATFSWSVLTQPSVGTASIDPNTGLLTLDIPDAGDYTVEIGLTDGDASTSCVRDIKVIPGSQYQVVIDCIGEPAGPVFQGQHVQVPVTLANAVGDIGGYDLLIAYDASAISFQSAEFGPLYESWEYLTYRQGANGNCSNACPTGLVRIVGIAETNNGADHPDYFGTGVLFVMDFLVTNDRTFQCSNVPLRFYWTDCGDNTLSNREGTVLFLSDAIYDGYDPSNEWGNGMLNIFDPEYGSYPTYYGAQIDCDEGMKVQAERAVSFQSGCVFIACATEIDDRGDLNLNGIANEVADAVLYSRYFVYGLGVFNPATVEASIAASDVNADGLALSVADLVYLIRVIIGDALPYADKLAPVATTVTVSNGVVNVADDMGAALVVVNGNVVPELLVDNMDMIYSYDAENNNTRVLVYSMNQDATFNGSFINANGNVESVELATYEGATVTAKLLPGNFDLAQNYPNPFNPTTKIAFSIPVKSDVNMTIYNITGQVVTTFSGSYDAGVHEFEWDASNQASGIYFYKLTAGNFEATKKMVLLK